MVTTKKKLKSKKNVKNSKKTMKGGSRKWVSGKWGKPVGYQTAIKPPPPIIGPQITAANRRGIRQSKLQSPSSSLDSTGTSKSQNSSWSTVFSRKSGTNPTKKGVNMNRVKEIAANLIEIKQNARHRKTNAVYTSQIQSGKTTLSQQLSPGKQILKSVVESIPGAEKSSIIRSIFTTTPDQQLKKNTVKARQRAMEIYLKNKNPEAQASAIEEYRKKKIQGSVNPSSSSGSLSSSGSSGSLSSLSSSGSLSPSSSSGSLSPSGSSSSLSSSGSLSSSSSLSSSRSSNSGYYSPNTKSSFSNMFRRSSSYIPKTAEEKANIQSYAQQILNMNKKVKNNLKTVKMYTNGTTSSAPMRLVNFFLPGGIQTSKLAEVAKSEDGNAIMRDVSDFSKNRDIEKKQKKEAKAVKNATELYAKSINKTTGVFDPVKMQEQLKRIETEKQKPLIKAERKLEKKEAKIKEKMNALMSTPEYEAQAKKNEIQKRPLPPKPIKELRPPTLEEIAGISVANSKKVKERAYNKKDARNMPQKYSPEYLAKLKAERNAAYASNLKTTKGKSYYGIYPPRPETKPTGEIKENSALNKHLLLKGMEATEPELKNGSQPQFENSTYADIFSTKKAAQAVSDEESGYMTVEALTN